MSLFHESDVLREILVYVCFNLTCFIWHCCSVSFKIIIFNFAGCPRSGYYGNNCSVPCPDPQCNYCDIETGICRGGCNPGYQGHRCELGIKNNTDMFFIYIVYMLMFFFYIVYLFMFYIYKVYMFILHRKELVKGCRIGYQLLC